MLLIGHVGWHSFGGGIIETPIIDTGRHSSGRIGKSCVGRWRGAEAV